MINRLFLRLTQIKLDAPILRMFDMPIVPTKIGEPLGRVIPANTPAPFPFIQQFV
jgi:hypothetical protein